MRAQTQQFHWVFVLIAGGVILLFFLFIIGSIKSSSDQRLSATLIQTFDAVFTGSQVVDNAFITVEAPPGTNILFACQDDYSEFSVDGASRENKNRILFSGENIEGRKLFLFTKSIQVPFVIDNALYVADPGIKYYVLNGVHAPAIIELMPTNLTVELISDVSQMEDTGFRRYVLVSDVANPSLETAALNFGADLVIIEPDEPTDTYGLGDVTFYDYAFEQLRPPTRAYKYFGESLLLGAIISGEEQYYLCAFTKYKQRVQTSYAIYYERTNNLATNVGRPQCNIAYTSAANTMRDIPSTFSDTDSLVLLRDASVSLGDRNREVTLQSCPVIY